MKTPNVQQIVDAVKDEFGTRVSVGGWLCRRIAGTLTWSQHSWTENPETGIIYEGNAADIFPINMLVGDQVAAFIRSEFPETIAHVLWRVKNHFDHVHVDTWPQGYLKPPCKGGNLFVLHKNGQLGRTFHQPAPAPLPPSPPPSIDDEMPPPVTPASNPQQIGQLQDLLNETYYYPKGEKGLTIAVPPKWGSGTSAAVRKWLLPKTNDTSDAVQAGEYVNFNMWNGLMADWVRVQAK